MPSNAKTLSRHRSRLTVPRSALRPKSRHSKHEFFLPPELWLKICDYIRERDVSSMSRTNRWRHKLLRGYLLRRNVVHSGTSFLPYVALRGDLELLQILQNYPNFTADARADDGDTALLCAIHEGHDDVALALIDIGGDHVNTRDARRGWRPLSPAVKHGNRKVVRKLLEAPGINVNGIKHTDMDGHYSKLAEKVKQRF